MENMTKLSVIIPAYNVAGYIEKTLQSVLNQTFEGYEIVVVDDGSSDETGAICDRYAENNTQITVIHQKNGGVMAARLKGFEISKGEWVTFLDGDDRFPSDSLQLLYDTAVSKDVDLVWGTRAIIDDNNIVLHKVNESIVGYFDNKKYTKYICAHPRSLHGMLFRRSVISESVVVDRRITNGEDQLFNLFISNRIQHAYSIPDVVHFYINRSDSATKQKLRDDYWYLFISYVGDCYKKYGVGEFTYRLFILTRVNSIIRNCEINCSHACFDKLKNFQYSSYYGIKANLILFVLKHPIPFFIRILRMHPTRFFKKKWM